MPELPIARPVIYPRDSARYAYSVSSTVLPIPRVPLINMARSGWPTGLSRASKNPSTITVRPAQKRGEAPKVGRKGLGVSAGSSGLFEREDICISYINTYARAQGDLLLQQPE